MLVLWFVLLASLLVLFLASPWLGQAGPLYEEANDLEELILERERTYNALADLDFDYEAGKLSEEDYRNLRQQLLSEAAEVLRSIDALSRGKVSRGRTKDAPSAAPRDTGISEDSVEAAIARYKRHRPQKRG